VHCEYHTTDTLATIIVYCLAVILTVQCGVRRCATAAQADTAAVKAAVHCAIVRKVCMHRAVRAVMSFIVRACQLLNTASLRFLCYCYRYLGSVPRLVLVSTGGAFYFWGQEAVHALLLR
jgi:hypothetical protein